MDSRYSIKSDVWSFGVVLWEIFSLGTVPYARFGNIAVMGEVMEGRRLPAPQYCPLVVANIIQRCWITDPSQRPDFTQLKARLARINMRRAAAAAPAAAHAPQASASATRRSSAELLASIMALQQQESAAENDVLNQKKTVLVDSCLGCQKLNYVNLKDSVNVHLHLIHEHLMVRRKSSVGGGSFA